MRAFYVDRLLGALIVGAAMLIAPVVQASTVSSVNLTLRLETTGYRDLSIRDKNFDEIVSFGFLDTRDNVFGIRPVDDFGFTVGNTVSLAASTGLPSSGETTVCSFGPVDCRGSFMSTAASLGQDRFAIGDGMGRTVLGDFSLSGGINVGDQVFLNTFEGARFLDIFNPNGSTFVAAEWSSNEYVFTVVENNLAPIPLPASVLMLLAALAGLGALGSMRRRPARALG